MLMCANVWRDVMSRLLTLFSDYGSIILYLLLRNIKNYTFLKKMLFISKLPDSGIGCRGLVLFAGSVFTSDRITLFSKVKSAFKVHDLKFI